MKTMLKMLFLIFLMWGKLNAQDSSEVSKPLMYTTQMPHFDECKDLNTNKERDQCTRLLINEHISNNFNLTKKAKKKTKENGTIVVQFVVNTKGEVSQ